MKTKIVEHIALDIWDALQSARSEVKSLKSGANDSQYLKLSVTQENIEKALKLVALLTKEDYDLSEGD